VSDDYRALMQDALRELRSNRARIAALERQLQRATPRDAVHVVGLGCRLPGGIDDPTALWRCLHAGAAVLGPLPADRWPGEAPPGAFLDDAHGFDAAFFRIAPRQARLIDPQQRLLLEVAHATIEHAGLAPRALRGSRTGVYVGISTDDWSMYLARNLPVAEIEGSSGPGTNHCAAAGRTSFALGLEGPSLAVNTACSSSLVALHLAQRALRAGECDLALVLGVNVMLSPFTTLAFARAGMLAADGRCKTFAAGADGYGRGEGAVGVLLATETAALRLGLRCEARLLGSAINQDGATAGLTVPSGPAQQRVLRAALADAGVPAAAVQFVEAHGTGTLLGDPIELQALAAVYGEGRSEPLRTGSVKTNFGHLEAAAGLLGVLKVILQFTHGAIAPHRLAGPKNPHVAWDTLPLAVPTTVEPWPGGAPPCAGVSAFSFTGTNAHAILAAPQPAPPTPASPSAPSPAEPSVLPISAKSAAAVRALAARFATALAALPTSAWRDACATAALGRDHHRVRLAVLAATPAAAAIACAALARGDSPTDGWWGEAPAGDARPFAPNGPTTPSALAAAYVRGEAVPWAEVYAAPFRRVVLPTYAFQHRGHRVPPTLDAGSPPLDPTAGGTTAPAAGTLRQQLAAASAGEQDHLLVRHVQATAAAVLRLPAAEVSADAPLADHGFDSMLAVELATRLGTDLGLSLSFAELLDGATANDVGRALGRAFRAETVARPGDDEALLGRIAAMSPAEAERLLREIDGDG
jgi:acyl transferase domain-containing protein